MSKTILFVGTDTDVGKTFVVSTLARHAVAQGQRVGVYKPVASGCEDTPDGRVASDAKSIWDAAGQPLTLDDVCPQKFLTAIAPDAAARVEGTSVDEALIRDGLDVWRNEFPVVFVEGAGGLFSPLSDNWLNIDLVRELAVDHVVLVAANRIGVMHQVLCCIEAAMHHSVRIDGIILSTPDNGEADPSRATNSISLASRTPIPILAALPWGCSSWPTGALPVPGLDPRQDN